MLDVCLLGTGGMLPLPNRWLTALMARYNGSSLLIDCGEGTQVAIREKGWSFKPIDVICFTHYHADHISGLPGLLLTMGNAERTEPLTMIGPRGLERVVGALRVIAPELPFEIRLVELTEAEETFEQMGCRIHAFRVNHNIACYGYSVEIPRAGRFYVDRAEENGIPKRLWSLLQHGQTVEEDGRICCFSGPLRKVSHLVRKVDLHKYARHGIGPAEERHQSYLLHRHKADGKHRKGCVCVRLAGLRGDVRGGGEA